MRITFLLPGIGLVGGIKTVFEYANRLVERHHSVSIVYPYPTSHFSARQKVMEFSRRAQIASGLRKFPDFFDLKADLVAAESLEDEKYIPNGDAVVATWWETAYDVARYGQEKGSKYYLIQHYEIWGGPKDKVDASYRLGLHNIAVSDWVRGVLEGIGAKVEAVVPIGIDFSEFYPVETRRGSGIRILTPYRDQKWKGVDDALEIFKIIRDRHDNAQLVMYGTKIEEPLPEEVEFHLKPSIQELNELYNSCDIFLYTSWYEGFALPPLEAMACKIPVVSTKVGILNDFSSKDALLCPPRDILGLAEGISTLIDRKDYRAEIAENGYNAVKAFTWEKAVNKLESLLKHE